MEYGESGATETISQCVDWLWSPDEASTNVSTTFSSMGPITWGMTRKWKADMRWASLRTLVLRLHGGPDVPGPGIPTSWIRPDLRKSPLTPFDLFLHREPSRQSGLGQVAPKECQGERLSLNQTVMDTHLCFFVAQLPPRLCDYGKCGENVYLVPTFSFDESEAFLMLSTKWAWPEAKVVFTLQMWEATAMSLHKLVRTT